MVSRLFVLFLGRALVILFFAWAHWARASHAYGTHRARIGTMRPHVSAYVPHNARLRAACHYWTLVLQTRFYVVRAWIPRGSYVVLRGSYVVPRGELRCCFALRHASFVCLFVLF